MIKRTSKWVAIGIVASVGMTCAGMAWAAQNEPTTQTTQPTKRPARLVQPWNKVTDLTDEQRDQLIAIHAEITAKINALRAEEEERCNAILSEEQRAALTETLAREAAERKARAAEQRAARATTKPAD